MINRLPLPTKEEIQRQFNYENGFLVRKTRRHGRASKIVAGHKTTTGYTQVFVNGKNYMLHRIVWVYHNGAIPNDLDIDHIDRDIENNRIENLQLVDRVSNQRKRSINRNNTSGVCGVTLDRRYGRWVANICNNGKQYEIGRFVNFEEAVLARKSEEDRLGYHRDHGMRGKKERKPAKSLRTKAAKVLLQ